MDITSNQSLTFLGLLYATSGGKGNVSARCGSFTIVLQCFFIIPDIEGSLGSKVITNTGLTLFLLLVTFLRASALGIFLALSRGAFINFGL